MNGNDINRLKPVSPSRERQPSTSSSPTSSNKFVLEQKTLYSASLMSGAGGTADRTNKNQQQTQNQDQEQAMLRKSSVSSQGSKKQNSIETSNSAKNSIEQQESSDNNMNNSNINNINNKSPFGMIPGERHLYRVHPIGLEGSGGKEKGYLFLTNYRLSFQIFDVGFRSSLPFKK